jgi:hypothetical protein
MLLGLFVFLVSPPAFSQTLDNQWFQVKAKIKGFKMDIMGLLTPYSATWVNYLYLTWLGSEYSGTLYDASGNLIRTDNFTLFGVNEEIAADLYLQFANGSDSVESYQTSIIKTKKDSLGGLKKATIKSMGCEIYAGNVEGDNFFGGCISSAQKIDSPPFTP